MKKKEKDKNKIKIQILEQAKILVRKNGWSKNIIKKLISNKLKSSDLIYYFPNGYIDLLNLALYESQKSLELRVKKTNIINLSLTKRIKKILTLRLEIFEEDKVFYKKTFYHLILPQNSKVMKKNLYKTIDNMWYLAGDNSTDFSFYTKRITLAAIYINTLYVYYNKDIQHARLSIDKNLERISKIPIIKERFSFIKDSLPIFLKGIIN